MGTIDLIPRDDIADWTWTNLRQATDRPSHPFHLLTMATVSPDGRPAARLMTNRGADRSTGRLWLYTRLDTPKVADIRARPCLCLVAYDAPAGVQIRLSGTGALHGHGAVADQHWNHVAQVSQWLLHLSPEQGAAAVGIDPRLPLDPVQLEEGLTVRARAQFGVLEVVLDTIDWHQATGTTQRRAVMHAADQWRPVLLV